jgi:hypothetical protein
MLIKWIQNLIKRNTALLLKAEWIVEDKKPKKKTKKKTKKKKKKKKGPYDGPWNGRI